MMDIKIKIFLLVVLFVIFVHNETGKFLLVSDIHHDLYYTETEGPKDFCRKKTYFSSDSCIKADDDVDDNKNNYYGQLGCDSPTSLVHSSFDAMHQVEPNPDFILFTGDIAAHCYPNISSIVESAQVVSQTIREFYPDTLMLPTLGNNDVYPKDQIPLGSSKLLSYLGAVYSNFLPSEQTDDFSSIGRYSIDISENLVVLSINTILYMPKWCDSNTTECVIETSKRLPDPNGQFIWIEKQLNAAKLSRKNVYILAHTGPERTRGMDDQWIDIYQFSFNLIIEFYQDIIKGIFLGHIHRDMFTMVLSNSTTSDLKIQYPILLKSLEKPNIVEQEEYLRTKSELRSKFLRFDPIKEENLYFSDEYFTGVDDELVHQKKDQYFGQYYYQYVTQYNYKNINTFFIGSSIDVQALNNPSFKLCTYNTDDFTLIDCKAYFFDFKNMQKYKNIPPNWIFEYSYLNSYFNHVNETSNLSPINMQHIFDELLLSPALWEKFTDQIIVQSSSASKKKNIEYKCAMTTILNDNFELCSDIDSYF